MLDSADSKSGRIEGSGEQYSSVDCKEKSGILIES